MKNIKIIQFDAFNETLKSYWNLIEKSSDLTCFQTYDWSFNWYINIGIKKNIKINVLVIIEFEKPVMLLPFIIEKSQVFNTLKFISHDLADYLSIIYCSTLNQDKIKSIFSYCLDSINNIDLIHLEKIPQLLNRKENLFVQILQAKNRSISYQMILPNNIDGLKGIIKKKVLADTGRQIRRISKDYDLKFNFTSDINEIDDDILLEFIHQKRSRFQNTGANDIFQNIEIQNFYKNFVSTTNDTKLHFSWLTANDEVIACHWGIVKDDDFFFLVPTFSAGKWNKFSPGKILLQFLLEWAVNNSYSVFDFTIGAENYKKVYCNSKFELFNYVKFVSLKSRLLWPYYFFIDVIYNNSRIKYFIIFLIKYKNKLFNGYQS